MAGWETRDDLPQIVGGGVALYVDGLIYILPWNDGVDFPAVDIFSIDPETDAWDSSLTPRPTARMEFWAATDGRYIYVGGGQGGGTRYKLVERYDTQTDTWDTVADMPITPPGEKSITAGAAYWDGKLYVLGGYGGTIGDDNVFIYDIAGDSWATGTDRPTPSPWLAVGVVDGIIYTAPGNEAGSAGDLEAWSYDIAGDSWTQLADAPTRRELHVANPWGAISNGKFLVYGGFGFDDGGDSDVLDIYDIATDTWSTETNPVSHEPESIATFAGADFHILGGQATGIDHSVYGIEEAAAPYEGRNQTLGGWSSADKATPAHFIVGPGGRCCWPIVESYRCLERANGGQMGMTGRIDRDTYERFQDVLVEGADWYVVIRETGEAEFAGRLKRPALGSGPVVLSADGDGTLPEKVTDRLFFAGSGSWVPAEANPHRRGNPPDDPVDLVLGGAGNVNVGIHRYKVTFVTAEGETAPGPRETIDVTASAKHVLLSDIPTGPDFVTARKLYRTEAGGSTYKLVDTISNNTATTYDDNIADGSLGATAPGGWSNVEIEASAEGGRQEFRVARGSDVSEDQMQMLAFPAPDLSAVEGKLKHNRDATGWTVRLYSAENEEAPLNLEEAWTLDDSAPGSFEVDLDKQDAGAVFLALRSENDVTNAQPLKAWFTDVMVYGLGDADSTTSDVVRTTCRFQGVSTDEVRESGQPAMPQDFVNTTHGEPLDLMALMSGISNVWRWLYRRRGRDTVCDFGPFGNGGRTFRIADPEPPFELLPVPRFFRVTVWYRFQDGAVVGSVSVVADPLPPDIKRPLPELVVALEAPASREAAENLARVLVATGAKDQFTGTGTLRRVYDESGRKVHARRMRAGDRLLWPGVTEPLNVDQVERSDALPAITVSNVLPLIERFNARRERRMQVK